MTYRAYYKSILSDDWGMPIVVTEVEAEAVDFAYAQFEDGQWSIVTKDHEPHFIDHDGKLEDYEDYPVLVAQYFEGRYDV